MSGRLPRPNYIINSETVAVLIDHVYQHVAASECKWLAQCLTDVAVLKAVETGGFVEGSY